MNFLNNQTSFLSVFGHNPQPFGSKPSRLETGDIGEKLRMYADKCMFDVFLAICREDYIGIDDDTSDSKMVYKICKRLTKLRMEWITNIGNCLMKNPPNELYGKFIGIMAGLTDNATVWPLPFCNTYFSALGIPLQDKNEADAFCMPSLHGLTTKSLQLGALCMFRSAAVQYFKSLNDK